jgi:hypothetical protein
MLIDKANTWLFRTFTQYVGARNRHFMSANSGCDILLIGFVCFFVIVVATGRDCDPLEVPLLHLLVALSAFPTPLMVALDGAARLPMAAAFPSYRT